jgi:hypothetical protein
MFDTEIDDIETVMFILRHEVREDPVIVMVFFVQIYRYLKFEPSHRRFQISADPAVENQFQTVNEQIFTAPYPKKSLSAL